MKQWSRISLILALTASLASAQGGSYTLIDVGAFAPGEGVNVTGINELGHAAGYTDTTPFLFRNGQLINLGNLPGGPVFGGSKGVNNLDQVVGWAMAPAMGLTTIARPFYWTEDRGMVEASVGISSVLSGECWGVNDSGQLALSIGGARFFDPVKGFTRIHFPGMAPSTGRKAWELNQDGVVCGSAQGENFQLRAFRYISATDTICDLSNPAIDRDSEGYGINDFGDIAGYTNQWNGEKPPMLWKANGETVRLPVGELGPNHKTGRAEHVNNHGDIVGKDAIPGPTGGLPENVSIGWVAFGAVNASPVEIVKTPLLSLLEGSAAAKWLRLHPFEINDRGEIAGLAVLAAGGPAGGARGFVMVPNQPDHFRNLAHAVAGSNGHPVLIGQGSLAGGTRLDIALYKAAPNAPCLLVLSTDTADVSLLDGVFVPDLARPGAGAIAMTTDSNGAASLSIPWPARIPAGINIVAQFWIVDAAGPRGFAASNAIIQTTP